MSELDLEFDEPSHTYTQGGVTMPSVTQILSAIGASCGFGFLSEDDLKFYRDRGHAVHKAVELTILGTWDKRTGARWLKPYLTGWDYFVKDYNVSVIDLDGTPFVERRLFHPAYRFAVTPDVVAMVNGKPSTIEIKATSAHAPATGLQLAAQRLAIKTVYPAIGETRIGLRLLPKEPYYDLRYYTERSDEAVFLSLLNGYSWLKKNKLLKEKR